MDRLILITDPGYDADDAVALTYLVKRKKIPDLVVTSDESKGRRADLAYALGLLMGVGLDVVRGVDHGNNNFLESGTFKVSNFHFSGNYLEKMAEVVDASNHTTIIGIGAFAEVAAFLRVHRDLAAKVTVYQMGGHLGRPRRKGWVKHNVKIDIPAAQELLRQAGSRLYLVMAQTTFKKELEVSPQSHLYRTLKERGGHWEKFLIGQVEAFHQYHLDKRRFIWPRMHDPITCAAALGEDFVRFICKPLEIRADGSATTQSDNPAIHFSQIACKAEQFVQHLEEVLLTDRQG